MTPPCITACAGQVAEGIRRAQPVALACDPSAEGVLAGVGITYLAHARPGQVRLASTRSLQPQLGEKVVRLPAGHEDDVAAFARRVLLGFAARVVSSCRKRDRSGACPASCSATCARRLVYATASDDPGMPEVVHQYLRLGFAEGPRIREMIANPMVSAYDALARYVAGECEHTRQFVRFSHMSDGSYIASFTPKANTIPLVAAHFAARMGTERFCLVDPRHLVAAFHEPGERQCHIVGLDERLARDLAGRHDLADDEPYVRAMWQRFYRGTSLPGRAREQRGYDLRVHWMPKRFWDGLYELDDTHDGTALSSRVKTKHELAQ